MAKRREGQRQEAYEAGTRGTVPVVQPWIEALGRGLSRELFGADMGSPFGQRLREELGSLGYEQALREAYPEEYAQGRNEGPVMQFIESLPMMGMGAFAPRATGRFSGEVLPPSRVSGGPVRGGGPTIEGRATGPGLKAPPPRQIADMPPLAEPGYQGRPMGGPMNQFERNSMDSYYRNTGKGEYGPYTPGARSGFRYRDEHMPRTSDMLQPEPGYVDVERVINPEGYYHPGIVEHMSAQMRGGNRAAMRHPYYEANADRPPYGAAPEGYVSPIVQRPAPGVGARYEPMLGPAPFGEGAPGRGYYGNMPNPGVRSNVRNEMGTGAGAPRLRYEPVGEGGGGVPAVRGGGAVGPAGGSYGIQAMPSNLPMMARGGGRGLVPREIAGEYSEVQGIPYYGQAAAPGAGEEAAWWNGDLGGVTGGGAARGRGIPYGAAASMAGPALVPLAVGAGGEEDRQRYTLPEMPIGRPRHQLEDMVIGRPRHQLEDMHIGQAPVYATPLYGEETSQPLAPQKVEKRGKRQQPPMDIRPKAQKEQPQQESGWAPNLNYDVTRALDQLFGQNRAEEGRRAQQYWETHPFQGW